MFLPNDIVNLILEFLLDYELLEWIDSTRLCWADLSANPNAIHILEQNKDKNHLVFVIVKPKHFQSCAKTTNQSNYSEHKMKKLF